jgi:hypothetical protein
MATATRGAGAESSRRQRWCLAQGGRSEEEDVVWRIDLGAHGWSGCWARWEEGAAGGACLLAAGRPEAEML